MLYQRYFLKMNQSNMTNMLTLLILIASAIFLISGMDSLLTSNVMDQHNNKDTVVLFSTMIICVAVYGGK